MDPSAPAILTRALTKEFVTHRPPERGVRGALRALVRPERATVRAVTDVDLRVDPGELVLLLGPNGAGKSTLIKMLTGVVRPTSGEVRVAGIDPRADHVRHARSIGTVFGQRSQLWWDLPVRQSYEALRAIYDVPQDRMRRRLAAFDEVLELSEFWDQRMRHLSLGQRVRADLAGALLHEPEVIFLDEPTIGMDVVAKDQVRGFLRREVAERGCAVLLTTHDMNEVKRLGSRVVVINHGHIVSDGALSDLLQRFGASYAVQVTLADPGAVVEVEGMQVSERRGPLVRLVPVVGPGLPPLPLQAALARVVHALDVQGMAVEEDELEDVMRTVFTASGVPSDPLGDAVRAEEVEGVAGG